MKAYFAEPSSRVVSMNSYLSLTDDPSRSTPHIFQELDLHVLLSVEAFEFLQACPLVQAEVWRRLGVSFMMAFDPTAQRFGVDAEFFCDMGDRPL
ncbi:hypothetical protein BJF83_22035 [Nocardiopsis sp. CNR-923]|nr:hypothetical protein BJF83_22035 [Nocardiopsis sp. CNR-923]